ncbi:MAG: hypothetical protein MR863_05090 [Solobacterium sp.]|nr:hypothetical protein [Solobacterium sp.]
MALVVLIGCLLQRKSGKDTVVSVIKTIVGMMILNVGSGQLKSASEVMINMFTQKMGIQGVSTDMWTAVYAYIDELTIVGLGNVAMVMITAWLCNVVLARITPIKTIFLTGHTAYMDSAFITFFVWRITGFTGLALFFTAVAFCAVYWWLFPALLKKFLVPLLGENSPITIGHNCSEPYYLDTL